MLGKAWLPERHRFGLVATLRLLQSDLKKTIMSTYFPNHSYVQFYQDRHPRDAPYTRCVCHWRTERTLLSGYQACPLIPYTHINA